MPIFEYKCKECGRKFEVFFKSLNSLDEINCPKCYSGNVEKLFSTFNSVGSSSSSSENFSCCCEANMSNKGSDFCSSGMCNLNN
ncbi:MAG: zinc ribbon domain-containing protein [Melioribacter sp.]|nr:zinc ribbon domain-containing protein [Melioribacter sp.]